MPVVPFEMEPANPSLDPRGWTLGEPDLPEGQALAGLALDLRRSWSPRSDELWAHLDPELWRLTGNPRVILETMSDRRLAARLAEPAVRQRLEQQLERQREHFDRATWFEAQDGAGLTGVAYFSMEYMLSEALRIY